MIAAEARGAWREIETRLRPYVARRVPASEVDDVVQEILARVHAGVAGLRDDERFGGWVYRVAASTVADFARRRARAVAAVDVDAVDAAGEDGSAADLQAELGACVALFVARLPSPYREAVTLTELRGLTQKEAALMVGVSLSGLKSRVQRGREKIRAMFEDCCEITMDARGRVIDCEARASSSSCPDLSTQSVQPRTEDVNVGEKPVFVEGAQPGKGIDLGIASASPTAERWER